MLVENTHDGNDCTIAINGNCRFNPTEVFETRFPFRVENCEMTQDSGCAGKWRGGLGYTRTLLAAEATGVARECTRQAAEYAKARTQFGRPIAMYQAVKHHCANMAVASELATAAVWDASRAVSAGGSQFNN